MIWERRSPKPIIQESDRIFWVLYSLFVKGWKELVQFVQVRTVTEWKNRRFKKFWARKSQGRGLGRPKIDLQLRELIRKMSRANLLRGTPKIIGELKKLGIVTCRATVDKYRTKIDGPASPTWKSFMKNESGAIAEMDFFTVPTAGFKVLYVFVVMMHKRREIVHFNVTANPTAAWTAQQIVEAFPWDTAPKYLLRDNDGIYGYDFTDRVKKMGIKEVKTAPRSPWQNPYVERLIGSIRRDCLDHVIVLNESHLHGILKSYFRYHQKSRTHLGLEGDCPEPRAVDPPTNGKIVEIPKVGGLHHQYERKAA
jgi:putative transposase